MNWMEILAVKPGITAVIGSGGKTTLLRTLGDELAKTGDSVLLCTTTKIFPFEGIPCITSFHEITLKKALEQSRLICAGTPLESGKLTAPPMPFGELAAQFKFVLVEADGSAHLPLKAHAPHEPVIPPEAIEVICVVGASGLGKPILEAAHRAARYAALAKTSEETAVTPEIAAAVLKAEHLGHRVLVNQAELVPDGAKKLASLLGSTAVAGSLTTGVVF